MSYQEEKHNFARVCGGGGVLDVRCLRLLGPRVGMATEFLICVGKPKSFEKSAHEVCPQTLFLANALGSVHGQTFCTHSGSLVLRSRRGSTSLPVCRSYNCRKKKGCAGRLRGQTFQKTWVFLHKCEMRLSCRRVVRTVLLSTHPQHLHPRNYCKIMLFSYQPH